MIRKAFIAVFLIVVIAFTLLHFTNGFLVAP